VKQHELLVPLKLRYFQSSAITAQTKSVWIVLHGYGQLVEYFHRRAAEVADENTVLVFPEGPHRFYLEGHSGKVGASWMTREWREQDIQNNISYLETLASSICSQMMTEETKIGIIGFSQGAATAMQWMFKGNFKPHKLVLWAGTIPPELDYASSTDLVSKLNPVYVFGNTDQYFNEENIAQISNTFSNHWPNLEVIRFDGGHYLDAHVLRTLNTELISPKG
jgi:predicted esterase